MDNKCYVRIRKNVYRNIIGLYCIYGQRQGKTVPVKMTVYVESVTINAKSGKRVGLVPCKIANEECC